MLFPAVVEAQWVRQSIPLRPGWNAVFLEVHPEPDACDTVFAGLPVESVWDFNRLVDLPQFVQDPTTLTPGSPGWLTWFPAGHPLAGQGSLFIVRDGRPYLIKLASNAAPVTLTITGRPSLRQTSWYAGGMNLAGFHLGATGPTFQALFAGESGLVGQPVYSLDAAGVWRRVLDVATSRPRAGEAYWIRCASPAERTGTIVVDAGSRDGLAFVNGGGELSLRVRNTSSASRNVAVRLLASVPPPSGQPAVAGPVPLEYWRSDYANTNFGWAPFPSALNYTALTSGQEWLIRLGARLPATPVSGDARYQSVLEVIDDAGTRWLVPVSALPPSAGPTGGAGAGAGGAAGGLALASASESLRAGLWVGEAVLKAVSQPARSSDATTPRPAGGEFSYRLIVHVDAAGAARLLQRAYLVRKPEELAPDPDNPGFNRVETPARTLVLTDEDLIPDLVGPGEILGRRISAPAFALQNPLALSGGEFGIGSLAGVIVVDFNHSLSPFKHRYHPDHDNLDERFEQALPEGRESFTVTRTIRLEFSNTDPLGLNPPGFGSFEVGGVYRETFTGLHRQPINVSGTFRLVRVARAAQLNQ